MAARKQGGWLLASRAGLTDLVRFWMQGCARSAPVRMKNERRPQEPGLLRGLVGRTGSVQLALCSLRLSKRPGNASVAMLSR